MMFLVKGLKIAALLSVVAVSSAHADENLSLLQSARKLYGQGKLEQAIEKYNSVSKESDFWVDAAEEKAWAHTKNRQYGKALAELKSVTSPVFIRYASSEAIMLSAFVDLKICNYRGVAEKIPLFKQTMLPRVEALEELVKNSNSEFVKNWIQKSKDKKLNYADLGPDVIKLPRLFHRHKNMTPKKMKSLAQEELKEISKNLKKMKIIEVELIHRTQISDVKLAQDKDLKFDKKDSKDLLIFPVKEGSQEIWLDEIGKFEVETTQCPEGDKI